MDAWCAVSITLLVAALDWIDELPSSLLGYYCCCCCFCYYYRAELHVVELTIQQISEFRLKCFENMYTIRSWRVYRAIDYYCDVCYLPRPNFGRLIAVYCLDVETYRCTRSM